MRIRPGMARWRLKYCTSRACVSAFSRVLKVPRLRRLPVLGSVLREYSRYSPLASLRIMACLHRGTRRIVHTRDEGGASAAAVSLTGHVFPVARLAFGQPLDGLRKALAPRLLALGLLEPFDVFATMARRKPLERFARQGIRAQCIGQVGRCLHRRSRCDALAR